MRRSLREAGRGNAARISLAMSVLLAGSILGCVLPVPIIEPPPVPEMVTGVAASQGASPVKIVITWDAVPYAVSYTVYRSPDMAGPYLKLVSSTSTLFDDPLDGILAVSAQPYFYKVSGVNSKREEGPQSSAAEGWLYVDVAAQITGAWQVTGIGTGDWTSANAFYSFSSSTLTFRSGTAGSFSGNGGYTLDSARISASNVVSEGLVDNAYTVHISGTVMTWWDLFGIHRYTFAR